MNNLDRIFSHDASEFAKQYLAYLNEVLGRIDLKSIARFSDILLDARERGASIYFIGNGGSASTSSHFANDLAIGTMAWNKPFRVVSLTDNQAILTALANDYGFEYVFVRQLQVLARPGDVLVAISASGNSPNLVRAVEYAVGKGIQTVAITAFDGGRMKQIADACVHVPTDPKEYGPAEDAHMILDHMLGAYLMRVVKAEAHEA